MIDSMDRYYIALMNIAKSANSASSSRRICNSIAKSTTKAMRASGCSILLLDPQKEYLTTIGAYGLSDLYLKKGPLAAPKSLPEVLDGQVVSITDVTKDERVQYPQVAQAQGISSVLGVPILKNEETIGEIRVYTREPRQFLDSDQIFVLSVANVTSVFLEKTELFQLLQKAPNASKRRLKMAQIPKLPVKSLRHNNFAHPSEEEFTKLLDFYRIEWLYEPRSFPLQWKNGSIAEMFTPDFYLPELDLYVELTTLKQKLITEKNRKIRCLRELYPEINIKLLNKSDYLQLLAKYGYGPLGEAKVEGINQVLYSHTQIQRKVNALARQISRDYAGQLVVLVGILRGVVCFMADLMQHLSIPVTLDFMAISYYGSDDQAVKITKDLDSSITNHHVLMVEDIVDTGMTLNYILSHLSSHNPASLRVCTLLDKRARRLIDVPLDYVGFEIPDEFVVGYGLDYNGQYRNLPFIGILRPELTKEANLPQ